MDSSLGACVELVEDCPGSGVAGPQILAGAVSVLSCASKNACNRLITSCFSALEACGILCLHIPAVSTWSAAQVPSTECSTRMTVHSCFCDRTYHTGIPVPSESARPLVSPSTPLHPAQHQQIKTAYKPTSYLMYVLDHLRYIDTADVGRCITFPLVGKNAIKAVRAVRMLQDGCQDSS